MRPPTCSAARARFCEYARTRETCLIASLSLSVLRCHRRKALALPLRVVTLTMRVITPCCTPSLVALALHLRNAAAMEALGAACASKTRGGDVLLLHGEVGAGKSTFARGFVRSLVGDPALPVPSPTFLLANASVLEWVEIPVMLRLKSPAYRRYEVSGGAWGEVCHFDLYRLRAGDDLDALGVTEAWSDPQWALRRSLVEWPDRLADDALPDERRVVDVRFEIGGGGPEEGGCNDFGAPSEVRNVRITRRQVY